MNQTKKRLKIINLAISITDIDTIQLQILKLNQIKTDEELNNIIDNLQANNYAKAQVLITKYLENPLVDEIVQRVTNNNNNSQFDLYENSQDSIEPKEIQLEDMLKIQNENFEEKIVTPKNNIDFDSLLNITHNDIMNNNIDIKVTSQNHDDSKNNTETIDNIKHHKLVYPPIPYINKKFQNIRQQYPQIEIKLTEYPSVNNWLEKIKTEGYNEDDIEEVINYIYKTTKYNKAEASQLLLLTACTKSKYATFILARELYRGILLEKNIIEAFDIMYKLANNDNYPEALCDLAQFYEYGIGVKKDTKKALRLYDESMQMGITRALRHYDRLSKQKKSLFGLF